MTLAEPGCGAILCKAAMQAASLNVFINTRSMKDRDCATALEEEAGEEKRGRRVTSRGNLV